MNIREREEKETGRKDRISDRRLSEVTAQRQQLEEDMNEEIVTMGKIEIEERYSFEQNTMVGERRYDLDYHIQFPFHNLEVYRGIEYLEEQCD